MKGFSGLEYVGGAKEDLLEDAGQPAADGEVAGPFQRVLQNEIAHGVAQQVDGTPTRRFALLAGAAPRIDEVIAELEEAAAEGIARDLGLGTVGEI